MKKYTVTAWSYETASKLLFSVFGEDSLTAYVSAIAAARSQNASVMACGGFREVA